MSYKPSWRPGDWRVQCDRCGFDFKAHQLQEEWTGLMVCSGPGTNDCLEPRQPQDFIRGIPDHQTPPWTRPEPTDDFLANYTKNHSNLTDVAGFNKVVTLGADGTTYTFGSTKNFEQFNTNVWTVDTITYGKTF